MNSQPQNTNDAPATDSSTVGISVSAPPTPPTTENAPTEPVQVDRRQRTEQFSGADQRKNIADRRAITDRRVVDIGSPTGLERRRGPGRRRSDDRRSAEEGEMSDEQFEFVMAIDTYKRLNNRPFPTWTEVLEVVKQLGYRKVAASTIKLPNNNGR
ncbi:MAG: hypothetical protein FWD61_12285 [Phycisphaerales bacterium]|nr:hypothetical protein [Phycisphaerales bacterium]